MGVRPNILLSSRGALSPGEGGVPKFSARDHSSRGVLRGLAVLPIQIAGLRIARPCPGGWMAGQTPIPTASCTYPPKAFPGARAQKDARPASETGCGLVGAGAAGAQRRRQQRGEEAARADSDHDDSNDSVCVCVSLSLYIYIYIYISPSLSLYIFSFSF